MDPVMLTAWLIVVIALLYSLMVLAISVPLFRDKHKAESVASTPFISVVIAARNEAHNILECLTDMLKQDYPHGHFEVIIADDHSEDNTVDLCRKFIASHPDLAITLDTRPGSEKGKKAALARAISRSNGELILATDADTSHGAGWISSMTSKLTVGGHVMVLGPVVLENGGGVFRKIQAIEFLGIMGFTAGSAALGNPVMCNGANLLYRKDAWKEAEGYLKNRGFASGDDQFLMMWTRKTYGKHSVVFNNDREAIVSTMAMGTLRDFLQQRIRWVSKSRGYSDPVVIGVGLVTYLVNLALVAGLVTGIFYPFLLYITGVCFLVKMATDLLVVLPMASFFNRKKWVGLFIPAQVFQVFYVTITGLLGLIVPYRWKGRVIKA